MVVRTLRAIPGLLRTCGVVVLVGAIGEGLFVAGLLNGLPESVLNASGVLFAVVGIVFVLGFPVLAVRVYGYSSTLLILVLASFLSVTDSSGELPVWILLLGFWPIIGFCYLGAVAVEYLVREGFPAVD